MVLFSGVYFTLGVMIRVFFVATLLLLAAPAIAAGNTVPLAFWADPGAKKDGRVIKIEDHQACTGQLAYARVNRMPMPGSKGSLQPETVVELSDSGSVIQRWAMPVDEIVLGVRGQQIIVSFGSGVTGDNDVLLISSDRSYVVATRPSSLPEATDFACPSISDFGNSSYLRCFEYQDTRSKVIRHLAYQGPCT